jgi:hypothetical protein
MDLREKMESFSLGSLGSGRRLMAICCEDGNETSGSIKRGKFLDYVSKLLAS